VCIIKRRLIVVRGETITTQQQSLVLFRSVLKNTYKRKSAKEGQYHLAYNIKVDSFAAKSLCGKYSTVSSNTPFEVIDLSEPPHHQSILFLEYFCRMRGGGNKLRTTDNVSPSSVCLTCLRQVCPPPKEEAAE
jgi:hypothetical protein